MQTLRDVRIRTLNPWALSWMVLSLLAALALPAAAQSNGGSRHDGQRGHGGYSGHGSGHSGNHYGGDHGTRGHGRSYGSGGSHGQRIYGHRSRGHGSSYGRGYRGYRGYPFYYGPSFFFGYETYPGYRRASPDVYSYRVPGPTIEVGGYVVRNLTYEALAGDVDGYPAEPDSPGLWDARAEPGSVVFSIRPADASIYLDGRFMGLAAEVPETLLIEAGDHLVEVVRPGFASRELELRVEPGESITLDTELEPAPRP